MADLKPCPFCGGEAEICHVRDICQNPQDWYWARCLSCRTSGKQHPTEAEAVEAWNTRYVETCENVASSPGVKFRCSKCSWISGEPNFNYCPNCGRRVTA